MSLGQSQGLAVLGAPLDLVFQLEPDAGMDAASSCVVAEVVLGERRIDASRVRVTPLSTRAGQPAAVRVRASVVIDEPVVTVRLSAGCAGQMSRSYTFFSELPEAVVRSAMPLDIARLGALPGAAAPASAAAPPARARSAPPASGSAAPTPRVRSESSRARPAPAPAPRPRKPVAQPPQAAPVQPQAGAPALVASRLRMEPLITWTGAPGAAGTGTAAATAAAAAAAAGAASPTPASGAAAPSAPAAPASAPVAAAAADAPVPAGDVATPSAADQRVLALEAEMRVLKARDARHNASLAEMRSQLEALQANQGSPWTLPLLMALAIALAVLAWLLLRLRSLTQTPPAGAWLHSVEGRSRMSDVAFAPNAAAGAGSTVPAATSVSSVFSATLAGAPGAFEFEQSTLRASMLFGTDAVPAQRPRNVVKPEELFDVRQQAEFFTSVGEYEQAIAVLRKHIAEHEDSSPLAYLELLGLFYQLSRRTEYDALRQQFERHFAVRVPEMAQFAQRGQSLEHSPELLARIEAQWPTEQVCELLEGALFREPGQGSAPSFDLEAFDDLLLLQAVARTTPAGLRGLVEGRVRTTPAAGPAPTPAGVAMAAAAGVAAASLVPGDEPWATLERANPPADVMVPLPPLPHALDPAPLLLDIPMDFEAPPGDFARSEPLAADKPSSGLPEMPILLDIDLSDVGRVMPLDLPAVEPMPFDLREFPTRPILGSGVDQGVGFNPMDPRLPLPEDLELTSWDSDDSPDSIFSAWNAARTERVSAKPPAADAEKDKPEDVRG
ncbi:MAG: hypothetical protein ABWY08_02625 [Comamonas sp.]